MNSSSNNTVVLCIKEMETPSKMDTGCFVLYNSQIDKYIILTDRLSKKNGYEYQTRFDCEKRKHVLNYISTVMDPTNYITVIMYNFKLNDYLFNITYEKLDKLCTSNHELIGYDCVHNTQESFDYINKLLKNAKYMQ